MVPLLNVNVTSRAQDQRRHQQKTGREDSRGREKG